jgi:serine/threonine protein kinase
MFICSPHFHVRGTTFRCSAMLFTHTITSAPTTMHLMHMTRRSASADVFVLYSYGILLNEIFTRAVPYIETNISDQLAIIKKVLSDNIRPRISPNCPKPVSDLIRRCWDKNPAARPEFREVDLSPSLWCTKACTHLCWCSSSCMHRSTTIISMTYPYMMDAKVHHTFAMLGHLKCFFLHIQRTETQHRI